MVYVPRAFRFGRRTFRTRRVKKVGFKYKKYVQRAIRRHTNTKCLAFQNAGVVATGNGIDTTGRINEVSDLPIGSDHGYREGSYIEPVSLRVKGFIEQESTGVNNMFRILVFTLYDAPPTRTALNCLGELFNTGSYNIGSIPFPGKGKVFLDRTIALNHYGSATYDYTSVDVRCRFPKMRCTYTSPTVTPAYRHPIFVAVFSDSTVINDPGWVQGGTVQFVYKDN